MAKTPRRKSTRKSSKANRKTSGVTPISPPALKTAFARAEALGAPRKAVIFTESRETQTYYRTDHNQFLDEEIFRKLLFLPAEHGHEIPNAHHLIEPRNAEVGTRSARFFDEEVLKLDRWSSDLKPSLEDEIKELDKQICELRRTCSVLE